MELHFSSDSMEISIVTGSLAFNNQSMELFFLILVTQNENDSIHSVKEWNIKGVLIYHPANG